MKDQHTKIKGYRDLSQAEIDLMNRIKAHGEASKALIAEVQTHLKAQQVAAASDEGEQERIHGAQPARWAAIGTTHIQEGLMALTRAVAQPTTF